MRLSVEKYVKSPIENSILKSNLSMLYLRLLTCITSCHSNDHSDYDTDITVLITVSEYNYWGVRHLYFYNFKDIKID